MENRPIAFWKPSPNFKAHSPGRIITCVVLHSTATEDIESPLAWLTNPTSDVSAHYLIGKDGILYQMVEENNVAYHAGESSFNGLHGVNQFSIGIEMVNPNDGDTPYPFAQTDKVSELVSAICKDYDIAVAAVVGHCDVAPGRKTDPRGFAWDSFRESLTLRGLA